MSELGHQHLELPLPRSATSVLNFNYYSVDIDFGDFFLNFSLPALYRYYSVIYLLPSKMCWVVPILTKGSLRLDGSFVGWDSGLFLTTLWGSITGLGSLPKATQERV